MIRFVKRWRWTITASLLIVFANAIVIAVFGEYKVLAVTTAMIATLAWRVYRERRRLR